MEGYSHLQAIPNSPLSPLTPLSENTAFEFNFGGDGSLDKYINNVRQEHHVEKQQKKLLQHANRSYPKNPYPMQPKRYSNDFLKIRDVFEGHGPSEKQEKLKRKQQHQDAYNATPKAIVKITYTGTTPTKVNQVVKSKNYNSPQNLNLKPSNSQEKRIMQQQQKHQHLQANQNRIFRQASPVAAKALCSRVARILQHNGLSMYSGLFQKEEIDYFVFNLLKLQDLHRMGITNQEHCSILMHSIYYADQYF